MTVVVFEQAINDIRRKYELEKMEIANMEKDKVLYDMSVFEVHHYH